MLDATISQGVCVQIYAAGGNFQLKTFAIILDLAQGIFRTVQKQLVLGKLVIFFSIKFDKHFNGKILTRYQLLPD